VSTYTNNLPYTRAQAVVDQVGHLGTGCAGIIPRAQTV